MALAPAKKAFGSGHFGQWIEDEFGLPAYRYTCDQTTDPKAVAPVNEIWRQKTDHMHQVGNDRLVAVASNYGYLQVRQDEGSPKYLNDYDPSHRQFAGGFGYLTDGKSVLNTFYPGQGESFERTFGIGYYRKKVTGQELELDQIVFAPFGDDPLLVSQVTVRNRRTEPVQLRWIDYWGCQIYQFSYKAFMMSLAPPPIGRPAPEFRRRLAKRFEHEISVIGSNKGLLDQKRFLGEGPGDAESWKMLNLYFSSPAGKALTGGPVESPVEQATLEDPAPAATFLASLDGSFDDFGIDASRFFGDGGVNVPSGLQQPLGKLKARAKTERGLFAERRLVLKAGERRTVYSTFGYLPKGVELDALLAKYTKDIPKLLPLSCERWKANRIQLKTSDDDDWIDRELAWHNYYLRGNLTYDSFFKEHILSQGHVYQYIIGFQGAARDALQHSLPFIYAEPEIVKSIIRYTLKSVAPDGEIPYGIVGNGMYMPGPFRPSDLELWLLWVVSEYVLASRDLAFLDQELPTYPLYGQKAGRGTVRDLVRRCYCHLTEGIGTGKHGLLRLAKGDWNDEVVLGYVPEEQREKVAKVGESVLNAAMASYALAIYARLCQYAGEPDTARDALKRVEAQRKAVSAQWTGKWFRRAWLTEEKGWVGNDEMWLEPQPWTIIGSAATQEQTKALVRSIEAQVRQPSKTGAIIVSNPLQAMGRTKGIGVNGGIWPSVNGTLVWALALVDGKLAWDEWRKNTLAFHAEAYPDVWYGIWSGPDTYDSELSDTAGQSSTEFLGVKWVDFPVMNMHPHAWPLYSMLKLLGVEFSAQGVDFAPVLPKEEYAFASPLLEFAKTKQGYSGKYAPKAPGTWRVTIKLKKQELRKLAKIEINGRPDKMTREGDRIIFSGKSTLEQPLRWVLRY
jgi:hypothetical protein